jgi:hypothetical protein
MFIFIFFLFCAVNSHALRATKGGEDGKLYDKIVSNYNDLINARALLPNGDSEYGDRSVGVVFYVRLADYSGSGGSALLLTRVLLQIGATQGVRFDLMVSNIYNLYILGPKLD